MPTEILIIEDDPDIALSLQSGLAREGYNVIWKSEGYTGLEYATNRHPQLVILDVRLPDISGIEVCKKMRHAGLSLPILMLTVQREEIDKVIGLEVGADDYLTKPFGFRELLARVHAQLRRAYGELATQQYDLIYISDLCIDLSKVEVTRNHKLINLTPTEYRLLIFLARHANQTLTRNQILDYVWGYESGADAEQIVKVNIRRLREKIELDASDPQIVLAVPGVGYRLRT